MRTEAPSRLKLGLVQLTLSFAGAIDAGALYLKDRHIIDLPCTANSTACVQVANSRWAHLTIGPWHDIPLALMGLLSYVAILTLVMMKLGSETPKAASILQNAIWIVTGLGAAYSWYLQYVSHFTIGVICPYCITSACIMAALFFVSSWEVRAYGRRAMSLPTENGIS